MPAIFLVMLGGALGSGARYLVGRFTLHAWGPNYPWGTLAVNLAGGLLMGLLAGTLARIGEGGEQWRLLIGVGVLGGFTTFSAFSLDAVLLWERGEAMLAATYVIGSVVLSLAALLGGLAMMRSMS